MTSSRRSANMCDVTPYKTLTTLLAKFASINSCRLNAQKRTPFAQNPLPRLFCSSITHRHTSKYNVSMKHELYFINNYVTVLLPVEDFYTMARYDWLKVWGEEGSFLFSVKLISKNNRVENNCIGSGLSCLNFVFWQCHVTRDCSRN